MAEERIRLVPSGSLVPVLAPYVVNFGGERRQSGGITYRLGQNAFSGPVAHKAAADGTAEPRLRRELEVARFLGGYGGELLSKCVGYNFEDSPVSIVVTYRGRPLADIARNESAWPPDHAVRAKMITDLLQGVELLRLSSIVHGAISMNTLHWDGSTLEIVDFGQAALRGTYPDGRPAHHGDDIDAVCRVIYHVHTGAAPPDDPGGLRHQLEQVQDVELRDLLLRRDLVTGTDVDYAFAADRERRPTARMLLDRLDRRPHGVQWQDVVAREQAVRKEFQHLRERQSDYRGAYLAWAATQLRAGGIRRPQGPQPAGVPVPQPSTSPVSLRALLVVVAVVVIGIIVVLAVLR
jgi:hypothetical protein